MLVTVNCFVTIELNYSNQIYELQYVILFINSILTLFLLFFRVSYQIILDAIEKNDNLKSPFSSVFR